MLSKVNLKSPLDNKIKQIKVMSHHKHLIHREDLDKINEHLSQRAASDAGRAVGLGFLGYGIIVVTILLGVFTNLLPPKFILGGLLFGAALTWLSRNSSVHLNNPTDFT